jgi:hypothetical protein
VLGEYQESKRCFQEALETAIDAQSVAIALEALVGMVTLLTKEGEEEQVSEFITRVLHHSVIYEEIKNKAECLLSELEPQLLTHVLHHPAIYEEIKDRIGEIKDKAEKILSKPRPQLYIQTVTIAQESEKVRNFERLPNVISQVS